MEDNRKQIRLNNSDCSLIITYFGLLLLIAGAAYFVLQAVAPGLLQALATP